MLAGDDGGATIGSGWPSIGVLTASVDGTGCLSILVSGPSEIVGCGSGRVAVGDAPTFGDCHGFLMEPSANFTMNRVKSRIKASTSTEATMSFVWRENFLLCRAIILNRFLLELRVTFGLSQHFL